MAPRRRWVKAPIANAAARHSRQAAAEDPVEQLLKERGPDFLNTASDGSIRRFQAKSSRTTEGDLDGFNEDGNPQRPSMASVTRSSGPCPHRRRTADCRTPR